MIQLSLLGFKISRLILENIDFNKIDNFKKKYSYIFIINNEEINIDNFKLLKRKTVIVDLKKELEEIYYDFNKTTRNEINKTERDKYFVFIPCDDRMVSYKFYKRIKKKDHVPTELFYEFFPCIFFNAYYKNTLIASMSCWKDNQVLRIKTIVSLRKDINFEPKIISYASRRIIWEICKYGKNKKYLKLDLGGINFEEKNKEGITKFKLSFGGNIEDSYIYRYQTLKFIILRKILLLFRINIT
jgi:hypothetical protein